MKTQVQKENDLERDDAALRRTFQREFDELLDAENWKGARALLKPMLRRFPTDHWLISRLGLTYYEERRYLAALRYQERAARIAPNCPLVLWELAGCLQMLGATRRSIRLYTKLSRVSTAVDSCSEGPRWLRGLKADALFRSAQIEAARGERAHARLLIRRHMKMRRKGLISAYLYSDVRQSLLKLSEGRAIDDRR